MNEYLYGETLRWSFGFENPNKAAVVFACLLPLCWWAWTASWGIRRTWLRIPSLAFSAGVFLATGGCLVMTFSRGGLVAGVAALGYVWALTLWKSIRGKEVGADGAAPSRREVPKWWLSILLVIALVCLAVWSGLASRSVEGLAEDASVTNRFDLWKAGVQMACENPAGFGSGQSGTEFMQWYQATDRTEGYRTMVNSYLTFLVEQGWRVFALSVFGFLVFWFSTAPAPGSRTTEIARVMRASIMAFLVAGIFSTTMEDWGLWLIPACCVIGLIGMRCCLRPRTMSLRPLVWGLCGTCAIVFGIWLAGYVQSKGDPLARTFAPSPEGTSVIAIAPKGGKKTIGFARDAAVLGPAYGKLLRSLALETGSKILLVGGEGMSADLVVLAGDAVSGTLPHDDVPLLLLAPAKMEEAQARAILGRKSRILLLLPEIDEDGRSAFWRRLTEKYPREGLLCQNLDGVGTQVDWAWKQVIHCIRE